MTSPPATTPTKTRWSPPIRTVLLLTLAVPVLAIAAITVWFASFTGFSEYDDEGYVMIGLRSFLHGNALYDYVNSQYGPFYYLLEGALYSALHMQVNNNGVRTFVALFWLLAAVLCAWSVYRLTRSWIFSALGFTASVRLLSFFADSPGHPEEVCLVLLIGVLISAAYLSERATVWRAVCLGAVITALALTKINIGAFAALAIGLALLKATPGGYKPKIAYALMAAAGLCLPFLIMAPILELEWVQRTLFLLVLSLTAALLTAWHSESEQFVTPALWITCLVASGVTAALVVAPFLVRGTTLRAILYAVLLQHQGFAKNWYIPFRVRRELAPILALILAIAWMRLSANARARSAAIVVVNVIKVLISVVWFLDLRIIRWTPMYVLAVPFAWLVLVPATADAPKKATFARLALCLLTVFAALYLLPVAGAQIAFSLVLTIPMVCVFLDDARIMLVAMVRSNRPLQIAAVAAVVVLVTANVMLARATVDKYRKFVSLALPGAERIHVPHMQAADYQWIIATLKNSCDANYSMPGIFSLYLWTETAPPTNLLMSNWVGLLNQDQQQKVVNDLARVPRLCIVYNHELVEFWRRGQDLSESPLARYIRTEFVASAHRRDYVILFRRDHNQR